MDEDEKVAVITKTLILFPVIKGMFEPIFDKFTTLPHGYMFAADDVK